MPVKNFLEFLLYIAPGFLANEVYHAKYPVRDRGQFFQIAWSLVYGIIVYCIIIWIDGNYFNNFFHSNCTESFDSRFISILLISGVLFGTFRIILSVLRSKIALSHPKLSWVALEENSIWACINHKSVKDWAVVFLKNGSIYLGWISKIRIDPNTEDQDFIVSKAKRVNEDLEEIYRIDGQGVYLNTRDVDRIEFIKGKSAQNS